MARTRREITDEFEQAVADLIGRYWDELRPDPGRDDELSLETIESLGLSYPAAWVLVLGVASIDNPDAPAISVRYHPRGQSPFTGIGLLHDAVATWIGSPC